MVVMHAAATARPVIVSVALLVLCSAGGVAGRGTLGNQSANIAVMSSRPLADALLELQKRHDWLVTYEDSFYEFRDDVADVTASVSRNGKTEPKVFVPRPRPFQFNYQNADVARPTEVLTALLNAYHANPDNADRFRLMQRGSIYHVVPTSSRNAKGASVERAVASRCAHHAAGSRPQRGRHAGPDSERSEPSLRHATRFRRDGKSIQANTRTGGRSQ